jgi:hypothetical protein
MKSIAATSQRPFKLIASLLFIFGLSLGIAHSNSSGPPAGRSGAPEGGGFPAEPTCDAAGCHSTFPLNPDNLGKLGITGLPDNYVPDRSYHLTFSISHPDSDRRRWGFQMTAVVAESFIAAGNFVVTDRQNTQLLLGGPDGNRQYIEQTTLGTARGRRGGTSWNFDWVAPSSNAGDVAFYGSGNAANADGTQSGDKIYNPTPNPLAVTKGQFTFINIAATAQVAADSGRGVAVGDYDQDGRCDIFVAQAGQALLYHNNGDGTFTEVAQSAGIKTADADGQAAAWGDYDGDGDLDLYIVNAGSDVLYCNNGDGTFTDVTAPVGISDQAVGHAVAWADFTGSHRMDVYVANEGQDILYFNNGDGTFTKADPMMAGIAETSAGWSVAVADYNGDGKPDIFVANDGPDFLYKNNGDGTFTNVAATAGIQTANAQGRAAAWGDFDKDGNMDLFIANVGPDLLYKNNGNETFTDVTAAAGLTDTAIGAAAAWADYDNDGDLDLFVANEGQDFLYRNNGNGTFNEVAAVSGMTDMAAGRGAAWVDFNKDGNADLLVSNAAGGNFLYQNPGRSGPAPAASRVRQMSPPGPLSSAVINTPRIWNVYHQKFHSRPTLSIPGGQPSDR